jgi:D-alanyl-D-alanine dipeptidase
MAEEQEHHGGERQEDLDNVTIIDNGEPLVDFLAMCPSLRFAPQHPVFDFPRVHLVRESVARMLCEAAAALPGGLYLQIVEGYRPIQVQRAMFQHALQQARILHPAWSDERIAVQAGRYSAPPEAKAPPPHITGGAIDLEIVDEQNRRLDFSSPYELTDWHQAAPDAPGLTATARANRKLLREVLEPTGLTNYVDEWWHWSYGDNGWALRVGASHAIYDRIELPVEVEWVGDLSKLPE